MSGIIDLLLTAPDEAQALTMLDAIGWTSENEEGGLMISAPFRCGAHPVTLWRQLPSYDEEGAPLDEGEQTPGYWLGLCIPDESLLEEIWELEGVVAALDRDTGMIRDLKGFTLEQVNGLETITPVWAGPAYVWRELKMM